MHRSFERPHQCRTAPSPGRIFQKSSKPNCQDIPTTQVFKPCLHSQDNSNVPEDLLTGRQELRYFDYGLNLDGHTLRLTQTYKNEETPLEDRHKCRFCLKAAETPIHLIRFCMHPKVPQARFKIPPPLGPSGAPDHPRFSYNWSWKAIFAEAVTQKLNWKGLTQVFKTIL
jgi:hypothetical protein